MKRVILFLAGIVAALSIGAYAVTGGGYPSQPTFQKATTGGAVSTAYGNEKLRVVSTPTGSAGLGYTTIQDSAGTRYAYYGKASGGVNDVAYESDNALQLVANNGADKLVIDTSHNLTTVGLSGTVPWLTQTSGTATLTTTAGCSAGTNMTLYWVKTGKQVTLSWNGLSCTASGTSVSFSGTPAGVLPTTQSGCAYNVSDNGTAKPVTSGVGSGGLFVLAVVGGLSGTGTLSLGRGACAYDTDT